jgi:phosphatidylglycerophosphatase A
MNSLRKLIVTGLGAGYLPASGTWGSMVSCAIYLVFWYALRSLDIVQAALLQAVLSPTMFLLAAASSFACVRLGTFAEQAFGKKDPKQCTIDEIAGQAIALLLLPLSNPDKLWLCVLTAFLAFRFFDIVKPFPARRMEKHPYGWGVLLDDLAAGLYANLANQLVLRVGFGL